MHPMIIFILITIMAQHRNRFMHSDVYKSGETTLNRDRFDITKTGFGRQTRRRTTKTKHGVREKTGETKEFYRLKGYYSLSCKLYFSRNFTKQAYCQYIYFLYILLYDCKNCWPTFLTLCVRTAQGNTPTCSYCNTD
jgi:hypothetical protein